MYLKVFYKAKTPLTKWLVAAASVCDTNESQGFPQGFDAATFEAFVPAGKGVVKAA